MLLLSRTPFEIENKEKGNSIFLEKSMLYKKISWEITFRFAAFTINLFPK